MINLFPIQYLTGDVDGFTHQQQAESACALGLKWIQLRSKKMAYEELLQTAIDIRNITHKYGATFIVNDFSSIAHLSGADGVHLGKEDENLVACRKQYPKLLIGYSCNTIDDIIYAQQHKADYCGIGPYRFTHTRSKLNPILGIEGLTQIMKEYKKNNLNIPLVAIGGISTGDIQDIFSLGIRSVALSSFITQAIQHSNTIAIQQLLQETKIYSDEHFISQ